METKVTLKIILVFLLLISLFILPVSAQSCEQVPTGRLALLNDRVGYAEDVTGGSCLYRVTSRGNSGPGTLKDALSQSGRWIVFDVNGEIASGGLDVLADTTIDGRGADITIDGTLNVRESNVIIENIKIDNEFGNVQEDGITVHGKYPSNGRLDQGPTNIWIDHVDFVRTPDELLVMWSHKTSSVAPRDVTVTWNHFQNFHSKSSDQGMPHAFLIGSQPKGERTEMTRVTVANNVYETGSRQPSVGDGAQVHLYNNLHYRYIFGTGVKRNAKMLIENEIFDARKTPDSHKSTAYTAGDLYGDEVLKQTGSWMLNGATGTEKNPQNIFSVPYQYTLAKANQALYDSLLQNAGYRPPSAFSGLDSNSAPPPAPSGCSVPEGDVDYCEKCGPCEVGEGDCDPGKGQCVAGAECIEHPDKNKMESCTAIAAAPPTTPPTSIPDPTRDGYTLAREVNIADAKSESDLNVGIHEGESHGVRLEQFNGRQVLVFERRPGDGQWKGDTGYRSEIIWSGDTIIGYDEATRYVREVYYNADTLNPSGLDGWNTFVQSHSTSGAPQHSPMVGIRDYNGDSYRFARENENGNAISIGNRVSVPKNVWIREEVEFKLRDDNKGYAQLRAWRLDTGKELTDGSQLYQGPTQNVRSGKTYDPKSVHAYGKMGIYHRPTDQTLKYRARLVEVYVNKDGATTPTPPPTPTGCQEDPGTVDYCEKCGPCEVGEGDCDPGKGQCVAGAECIDIPNKLESCTAVAQPTPEPSCPWNVGDVHYCRDCGPCEVGEGDCDPGKGQCVADAECINIPDQLEPCTAIPAPAPTATCGDGTHDDNEECDDGNTVSDDGCSDVCQLEIPIVDNIPENAYRADYYNDLGFSGSMVTQQDAHVDFNWGTGKPHSSINSNTFSVRWVGDWRFKNTGTYEFIVRADDGIRVWIDDRIVVDEWRDQGVRTFTTQTNLIAGYHRVRVEYYENTGDAVADVSWRFLKQGGSNLEAAPSKDNEVLSFVTGLVTGNHTVTNSTAQNQGLAGLTFLALIGLIVFLWKKN